MHSARDAAILTLVAAVPAVVGGAFYKAIAGGTTTSRAIATAFWIAAAFYLLSMVIAGRKALWRRTARPLPEGSVFVTAAVALTVIGAVVDAL
ncbi:MAG TPA: hypothetical protein VFM96_08655 [Gaiellaceae bacterium]|nr:hypothetical protein [Gaiellaceae bacterium]